MRSLFAVHGMWERGQLKVALFLFFCGSLFGQQAGAIKTVKLKGVSVTFRWCPPGTFQMGSPSDETDRHEEEVQHDFALTKGFWMAQAETTQGLWSAVMGNAPSESDHGDRSVLPVEKVSWDDIQGLLKKVNSKGQGTFRLPTEVEWEYTCRVGSAGHYAGTGNLDDMGWYEKNSDNKVIFGEPDSSM